MRNITNLNNHFTVVVGASTRVLGCPLHRDDTACVVVNVAYVVATAIVVLWGKGINKNKNTIILVSQRDDLRCCDHDYCHRGDRWILFENIK